MVNDACQSIAMSYKRFAQLLYCNHRPYNELDCDFFLFHHFIFMLLNYHSLNFIDSSAELGNWQTVPRFDEK